MIRKLGVISTPSSLPPAFIAKNSEIIQTDIVQYFIETIKQSSIYKVLEVKILTAYFLCRRKFLNRSCVSHKVQNRRGVNSSRTWLDFFYPF